MQAHLQKNLEALLKNFSRYDFHEALSVAY